jgi:hypothetical protein
VVDAGLHTFLMQWSPDLMRVVTAYAKDRQAGTVGLEETLGRIHEEEPVEVG